MMENLKSINGNVQNVEISLKQIYTQLGIYIRLLAKSIDIFQDARFVFQNQKH